MIEAFKIKQSLFRKKYKANQYLIEDYSIIMSKLRKDITVDQIVVQIKQMLSKSSCTEDESRIIKVYFLFNISEYIQLYEQQF